MPAPTIRAAIYARKSTEQRGVAPDAKSVRLQKQLAREFAAERGWVVDDAFIFEDDGISGAEFEKRPGFQRMMAHLKPKPKFRVLIVSEQSRLGREAFETNYQIKQLDEAGVEIWSYRDKKVLNPKTWLDKATTSILAAADEGHRQQTSERLTEKHRDLARKGYVTGGRIFGYRNVNVVIGMDAHGRELRSHVDRVIDAAQKAVVRRIFQLYADGHGVKRIASMLNAEKALAPEPFKNRANELADSPYDRSTLTPANGWSPSTVRGALGRELYRGIVVWGKTKKKDTTWGRLRVRKRPESEWERSTREDLRIIDETLWKRVAARRAEVEGRTIRFDSGRISGRPPKHALKNLLAGLATCGVCGGGLVVEQSNNRKGRYAYYICHRHRHWGSAYDKHCTNALRIPLRDMNEAVLQAVEAHALTPQAVEHVVQLSARDDAREQRLALTRELRDLEQRIARLIVAVETARDIEALATRLRDLERRKTTVEAEVRGMLPIPRLPMQVVEDRLTEWRRLLRSSTTQGRMVLQKVLNGRIVFTPLPDEKGYSFEAPTRFDKLFSGVAFPRPAFIEYSASGTEHITAEDTFDADYGLVLENAVKGWCALHDSNVRPPGS